MLRAALDGADCSLELASNNSNNLSQGITFLVWLTGLFTPREYSTATSRALYKAIEEVERVQAARKAREKPQVRRMRKRLCHLLNPTKGNSGLRVGTTLASTPTRRRIKKTRSERTRPHRGWRGFTTPARAATKK